MLAHVLKQAAALTESELVDWGPVPEPLGEPVSRTSGQLLHREPDGASETGVWVCTPGRWRCVVQRAEFCHFLAGRCRYRSDQGDLLEIEAGDAAYFPDGWSGECEVLETVRKTYMIR